MIGRTRRFGTILRSVRVGGAFQRFVEIAADRRGRVRLKVQVATGSDPVRITHRPLPIWQLSLDEAGWLVEAARPFIEDGPASRGAWYAAAGFIPTTVTVMETIELPADP